MKQSTIGFSNPVAPADEAAVGGTPEAQATPARKSVVRVFFPDRNTKLSYYNDAFDLHVGDIVYVEGKLEGLRGRVIEVSYAFKIKLSDYKRVIAAADTRVSGQLFLLGTQFVAFDPAVLPYEKIVRWFKPPENDASYVSGSDSDGFALESFEGLTVKPEIAERGQNYYVENRVRYLGLSGTHGRAIVEGTKTYELEFELCDGMISNLTCDCYCGYPCKHEVAAMLQLRQTLKQIEKHYAPAYAQAKGFAAIDAGLLFGFAMHGRVNGSLTLDGGASEYD